MANERIRRILPKVLGVVFVVLLYATSVRTVPFYYDDYPHFVQNPRIVHPSSWSDVFMGGVQETRPLYNLSLYLQAQAFGMGPLAAHAINFALFVACGFMLWIFLGSVGAGEWVSLFSVLFFWIHPVALETVLYANSRSGLMAAGFSLAAFAFLSKSGVAAALCLILAMLSKEDAVGSVLVAAWITICFPKVANPRKTLPWVLPTLLVVPALYLSFSSPHIDSVGSAVDRPWRYLFFQGTNLPLHASMFFFPYPLGVNRDLPPWMMSPWTWSIGWTLILGWVALAVRYRSTMLGFAMGWACLALLPTHSVVPMLDVQASRIWFMALAPACLGMALIFHAGKKTIPKVSFLMMAAWVALLLTLNHSEQRIWREPILFWEKNTELAPSRWRLWANLAIEYGERNRWTDAEDAVERAYALAPREPAVMYNRAVVAFGSNRLSEAEKDLRALLAVHPRHVRARELLDRISSKRRSR